jgi:hypothetical protein
MLPRSAASCRVACTAGVRDTAPVTASVAASPCVVPLGPKERHVDGLCASNPVASPA